MLANLFRPKPLLDPDSAAWIQQQFDWLSQQFEAALPLQQATLVKPDNDHFPGRADSHQAMAQLLLERVQHYARLSHWPTLLHDASRVAPQPLPSELRLPLLADHHEADTQVENDATTLPIYFNPAQVNDPQAMISALLQPLCHALLLQAPEPPPIKAEQWPLLVELAGIYLGFGIVITNSAFVFAGGCGGCATRAAARQAFLSQDEALFGLALFCQRKGIGANSVTPQLKPHLKKLYRRAGHQLEAGS